MQMDKYTKFNDDGSVDMSATVLAYSEGLSAWVKENEIPSDTISTAIEAVFDRFPGQRLPMPALLAAAVAELSATPEQHRALTKRCHEYVKGQAKAGILFVTKGKGGGVANFPPAKKSA
jgi:hypothetical protein